MTRLAFRPACVPLEDRTTPVLYPSLATGGAVGQPPEVRVYDSSGAELARFLAYDAAFTGGVNVAVGDVTGDGVADIVTAPKAGGGSNIRVFDGKTFALVSSFFAFDPAFTGGVSVAVADLTADEPNAAGADIIVGAGAGGGPRVAVFHGRTGELVKSFFAFDPAFTGGVNVAAASGSWSFWSFSVISPAPSPTWTSGSLVVGAGPGGAPHVKRLNSDTLVVQQSFYAYDPGFRGGVNVAIDESKFLTFSDTPTPNPPNAPYYQLVFGGNGIVTGAGDGGAPHVKVFAEYGFDSMPAGFGEAASFYAGAATDTHGVKVELNFSRITAYSGQTNGPTGSRSYTFSLSGQPNRPSTATITEEGSGSPLLAGVSFGSLSEHPLVVPPSMPSPGLIPLPAL